MELRKLGLFILFCIQYVVLDRKKEDFDEIIKSILNMTASGFFYFAIFSVI